VGSNFTARLNDLLTERKPAGAGSATGSTNSLTPELVKGLPAQLREIIVGAYNDALTPIFLYILPLVLLATVLVCFVKEVPLKKTIDRGDVTAESLQIDGSNTVAATTGRIAVVGRDGAAS
jgi:hypothetical protein